MKSLLGLAVVSLAMITTPAFAEVATSGPRAPRPKHHIYLARLLPLNSRIAGNAYGWARFDVVGDKITARVSVKGAAPNMMHMQHIHTGTSCPTMAADTNRDGIVDVVEGIPAYGAILVPLDGDLSSQAAGGMMSPMANRAGNYNYMKSTSLRAMLTDLHMPNLNPSGPVAKLAANEALRLEVRHVVIHGVPESTALPSTAMGLPGASAQMALPIACGELYQVR